MMSPEEFKRLYMCTFEPDPRRIELEKALDRYYEESEHVDNRTARKMWSQLRQYARDLGITDYEFQETKMRATRRIK